MSLSHQRKARGGSGHPGVSDTLCRAGWSETFPAAGGVQGSEAEAAVPTPVPAYQASLCPQAACHPLMSLSPPHTPSLRASPQGRTLRQGTQAILRLTAILLVKPLTKHSPGALWSSGRHAMLPSAHVAGGSTMCPRPPRHGLRCSLGSPPSSLMTHCSPCQQTPQTGTATPLLHPLPGASTTAWSPQAQAEGKVAAICEGSQSDLLGTVR